MPKIILLPVSGASADAEAFTTALAIAGMFGSHIVALHVRPDVRRDIAGLAASDGGMAAGIDVMIGRMESEADAREQAASERWKRFCQDNAIAVADKPRTGGLTSEWVTETGIEADWLAEYGRASDLLVVGRGKEEWGPDLVLMEAALMDTGKPVVIAPPGAAAPPPPQPNGKIGIAWKDTKEAAGAVRAAMPFIDKATQVTIFVVPEDQSDPDKSHLRLARMLRWHNPHVTIQALLEHSRPPAQVLLDAAAQGGCGLLVMGGYGHTRLREAVFGGFTRAVLEAAPLPVLLAH